jgi:hypothetical protein
MPVDERWIPEDLRVVVAAYGLGTRVAPGIIPLWAGRKLPENTPAKESSHLARMM